MIKRSEFSFSGYEKVASSSVFSLQKQAINSRSDTELSKLDNSIDSMTSTKIKVNFNESAFKNQVYFKDNTSGEYIKIGLSDENLNKLKSVFDTKDFFSRDDGSTILNGKAESFVGGWFGDIAYKRGYLEADSNSDGFMSSVELMDTYSGFMSEGVYSMTIKADIATNIEGYIKFDKNFTQKHSTMVKENKYTSDTIEKELNRTLNSDKNSDGNITYGEVMNKDEHEQDVIDQINFLEGYELDLSVDEADNRVVIAYNKQRSGSTLTPEEKALLSKAGLLQDDKLINLSSVIENISANITKVDFRV
ncbi:hypothetical protein [Campylobacter porcelli]|uniref:EF-hand domain-containing protein n=1 Tax=Campylobacter porcelli TaxID=1660073 RepID=A0A1X9SV22_9BACT|nr:hypothetical protein [Campylobacter sp. RM6137]ARQ99968.1 hypothetical protein CSUIS_0112 [Campylobacter sp. RM6137]